MHWIFIRSLVYAMDFYLVHKAILIWVRLSLNFLLENLDK